MKKYKILTTYDVFALNLIIEQVDEDDEAMKEALRIGFAEWQTAIFEREMCGTKRVIYHFFNSPYHDEDVAIADVSDVDDFIQRLAIKDGVDIVRFSNGNIGFVSYYNGNLDGFECIKVKEME